MSGAALPTSPVYQLLFQYGKKLHAQEALEASEKNLPNIGRPSLGMQCPPQMPLHTWFSMQLSTSGIALVVSKVFEIELENVQDLVTLWTRYSPVGDQFLRPVFHAIEAMVIPDPERLNAGRYLNELGKALKSYFIGETLYEEPPYYWREEIHNWVSVLARIEPMQASRTNSMLSSLTFLQVDDPEEIEFLYEDSEELFSSSIDMARFSMQMTWTEQDLDLDPEEFLKKIKEDTPELHELGANDQEQTVLDYFYEGSSLEDFEKLSKELDFQDKYVLERYFAKAIIEAFEDPESRWDELRKLAAILKIASHHDPKLVIEGSLEKRLCDHKMERLLLAIIENGEYSSILEEIRKTKSLPLPKFLREKKKKDLKLSSPYRQVYKVIDRGVKLTSVKLRISDIPLDPKTKILNLLGSPIRKTNPVFLKFPPKKERKRIPLRRTLREWITGDINRERSERSQTFSRSGRAKTRPSIYPRFHFEDIPPGNKPGSPAPPNKGGPSLI
jgi:hypothetical protein